MAVLMILKQDAAGLRCMVNQYLSLFDPDGNRGRGLIRTTPDRAKAHRFADLEEALKTWKTTSSLVPRRDDGEPNRPLTAYSVTFETVE